MDTSSESSAPVARRAPLVAAGFLVPPVAVYALFVLLPIALSLSYSFYGGETTPNGPFVGMANYRRLVQDGLFWQALGNNAGLLILSVLVQVPLALIFASILTAKIPFRTFLRAAYFVPMILPTPAIGQLWLLLLGRTPLIGSADWAFWTLGGVVSWRHVGFHTVILMAGIESISRELYEAARVDCASRCDVFRHITLPLSVPVIRVSVLLSVLGSLRYFDLSWILWPEGSPGSAAELVTTYMFRLGIKGSQMGYASAVATALFVIAGVAALGMLLVSRRAERQEAEWA